jgi:hypothetical protein
MFLRMFSEFLTFAYNVPIYEEERKKRGEEFIFTAVDFYCC